MAYKQSTMQPITVQLQESKALASTCSMSNRFYEVGWDMEHLWNVNSGILSILVVVLLKVWLSLHLHALPPIGFDLINANLDALTSIQRQAKEQSDHQT
jgi:hypothetical protein